jgi:hypothetical protein
MRQLALLARELEPVRLELLAVCVALAQRLPLRHEHRQRFL